ncbi:AhpC/TSA family protein [Pedobacter hiemivivus]|uniref:AhpC/TSA family protein n=1 Tax=Pedobacter hiemivivus TaxID=2530454 RepID=A0A4U1G6T0_9SPHI|nr:TlpA disulfide reductase family protein [Pedobacter hiemivivus]TKC58569.1 AhpC/TSA family protein [Pedobacter hiemivivus]
MTNLKYGLTGLMIVSGLFVSQLSSAQSKVFSVNVKWPGGDGKHIVLQTNQNGRPVTIDSANVVNGTAVLNMPAPDKYTAIYMGVNNNYMKEILAYAGSIDVEISNSLDPMFKSTAKIKGSLDQDLFQEYNNVFSSGLMINLARTQALKKLGPDQSKIDQVKKDSIINFYKPSFDSLTRVQDYVTTKYADKDIAGFILTKRIGSLSIEEGEKQLNSLSERVRKGPYGLAAKNIMITTAQRKVGRPGFQFAATTYDNKEIKLADYKGKYVLLDFWSSTCLPCLRMAPYVKQLYDTYRTQGFEIIAVSLDTKRQDWIASLKKHEISGVQVSSLKGANDPIANYYGIYQMPAMVLIDRDGNNAGNVDPNRLDAKLSEIFNKK